MRGQEWQGLGEDELLDRLGKALAPPSEWPLTDVTLIAPPAAGISDDETEPVVVVPLVRPAPAEHRPTWKRLAAVAAAVCVLLGLGAWALSQAGDGPRTGVATVPQTDRPITTASDVTGPDSTPDQTTPVDTSVVTTPAPTPSDPSQPPASTDDNGGPGTDDGPGTDNSGPGSGDDNSGPGSDNSGPGSGGDNSGPGSGDDDSGGSDN